MGKFKIGELYDSQFKEMPPKEVVDNLEAVCYDTETKFYTKNLTAEELVERKDEYASLGVELSGIAQEKKEVLESFKAQEKEPKERSKELLDAIQFKSEQVHGTLFMVDDQEEGMMYFFDKKGVCVNARPMEKKERQLKLRTQNGE